MEFSYHMALVHFVGFKAKSWKCRIDPIDSSSFIAIVLQFYNIFRVTKSASPRPLPANNNRALNRIVHLSFHDNTRSVLPYDDIRSFLQGKFQTRSKGLFPCKLGRAAPLNLTTKASLSAKLCI